MFVSFCSQSLSPNNLRAQANGLEDSVGCPLLPGRPVAKAETSDTVTNTYCSVRSERKTFAG